MNVTPLFCVVAVGVLSSLFVRDVKPEYAVLISVLTAAITMLFLLPFVSDIIGTFDVFISKTGMNVSDFSAVLKAIGTGYLAEFVADLCERCGEKGLATKIELAEKIYIVTLCVPVLLSLAQWIEAICA